MASDRVWDWPDSGVRRRTDTVERLIWWSYASLSVTRRRMTASEPVVFLDGRGRATPGEFGRYVRGEKRLGPLDRETREQALHSPLCAHCGAGSPCEMDHLIPRSRGGANLGFNTVPCCASCNRRRGNKDLMRWYREQRAFPTLALMRHYLKLCYSVASKMDLLERSPEDAVHAGLPFDPALLPSRYPPIEQAIWDWRFSEATP